MLRVALLASVVLFALQPPQASATLPSGEMTYAEKAEWGSRIYANRLADAAHPKRVFRSLSKAKRAAVVAYLNPKRLVTRVRGCDPRQQICPSQTACYSQTFIVEGKNIIGDPVFTYRQTQDVCWQQNDVFTQASSFHAVSLHEQWFWRALDPKDAVKEDSGGVNHSYFRTFSATKVKMCFGGDIGCLVEANPWVRQARFTDPLRSGEGDGGW